jgi:glycosyltransferase involved in cell wall biosynthesis
MNILSINTFYPFPVRRGMDVIYYNLLKAQAKKHRVTLVSLRRDGREDGNVPEMRALCPEIYIVDPPNRASRLVKAGIFAMFSIASYGAWRPASTYYDASRDLARLIADLTCRCRFDLVEMHHSTSGRLVDHVASGMKILYMYDVHFRSWQRRADTKQGFGRVSAMVEASKYRSFETALVRKFDAVLFGQEADRKALEVTGDGRRATAIMPNIVDTDRFVPTGPPKDNVVLFVGAMTHRANVDAVMNFSASDWPRVRSRMGTAKLWIVGAAPPREVLALDGRAGIQVFADVPDVQPYIAAASVYVVPLRICSGIKVKILEALAMGKAIVATPIAAEGMGLVEAHDIIIAELGESFAEIVASLLQNEKARQSLERNARVTAVGSFGVEKGMRDLDAIYQQLFARVGS